MATAKKRSNVTTKKSSPMIFWIVGIIILLVIVLIIVNNLQEREVVIDYTSQPFLGDQAAPVQIVEFGDYKCPACKNFNESFVPLIEKELVETGQVSFYYMHHPFIHVDSTRAAEYAEAVYMELGNEVFWQFHDLLFSEQELTGGNERIDILTESFLSSILGELVSDEDVERVDQAFQNGEHKQILDVDVTQGRQLGISGTPTIYVNGKPFTGRSFDDLKKLVEEVSTGANDQ